MHHGRVFKWCVFLSFIVCLGLIMWAGIGSMHRNIARVAELQNNEGETDQIGSYKTLRQQIRSMERAQLNDIVHGEGTDPEIVEMAQRSLLELCERDEHELTLEGVLAMRGFDNPVVTVHRDSVNVLIQKEIVTQQESSIILELVCRETGVQSGNVKIIPIN